ncbi:ribokinase [Demequina sp. SYSU T00068]|uniref:ribokinase n=1 Tax=Demequina lignilytica TaxID=3051663 RepID=UPI00262663F7|nr:ribokinase [Demequina sp. SYSU T00068]MDN4490689.1 ribokinase [Demequina sp. SYSU T00068]
MDIEVLVVGSINVDLYATVERHPRPGETLLGRDSWQAPGGKGANQALAARLRGATTSIVGAVGTDTAASTALSLLERAGVETAAVAHRPGPTGLAIITLAEDGENTIIVVPGANSTVDAEQVDASRTIGRARVVVLQAELPLPTVEHTARAAATAGARVVINAAPACALAPDVVACADPLVVNEHEAAIVAAGLRPPGTPVTGGGDPAAAGRFLQAAGARSVVVTLGGAGCLGFEPGTEWTVPALRVPVVDTTGAGDAFVGALAAHLASGADLRSAAQEATRVAAASVQRLGAQPSYPGKEDPLP